MAKPAFTDKWGRSQARERYGAPTAKIPQPPDQQAPQKDEDKQGPKYDNKTSGWVHGEGRPHPHFDKSKAGR